MAKRGPTVLVVLHICQLDFLDEVKDDAKILEANRFHNKLATYKTTGLEHGARERTKACMTSATIE